MFSFLKKGCFGICQKLVLLGVITQIFHDIFDIEGVKLELIHHQLEFEIFLTICTILALYSCFKKIILKKRFNDLFQRVMLVGLFSNSILAIFVTIVDFVEMSKHLDILHGLEAFLLTNAIVSLIYLTFKYKAELEFTWVKTFIYETVFLSLVLLANFAIEFIGYDIVVYIIATSILAYFYKEEIINFFQKQRTFFEKQRTFFEKHKILVASLSTVSFILLWQLGALGF